MLPSVGARLLPGVLAAFRKRHPGVEVSLLEHDVSGEFERMVQAGELDLAVTRLVDLADEDFVTMKPGYGLRDLLIEC